MRETLWRKVLAVLPPGGNSVFHCHDVHIDESIEAVLQDGMHPTLDKTNVKAIAVTGAPNNLPTSVVFPNNWANEAVNERTAMLPQ